MNDEYNPRQAKNDNIARMLALIGITIAVIALLWAIKADNHANDLENQIKPSNQQQLEGL